MVIPRIPHQVLYEKLHYITEGKSQVMSSSLLKESLSRNVRSPARIAILECDTPLEQTRSKYGGYGGVFTALLHAGADALDLPRERLEITSWDIVNGSVYPQLEDVDAILLTGSRTYLGAYLTSTFSY